MFGNAQFFFNLIDQAAKNGNFSSTFLTLSLNFAAMDFDAF
jgi:hypothetical protein